MIVFLINIFYKYFFKIYSTFIINCEELFFYIMKLSKILIPSLSILTLSAIGVTVILVAKNHSTTNNTSSIKPEEPEIPTIPGEPELPIIPSNNSVVESAKVISNIDKFEIQILGKNLVLDSKNYHFKNKDLETKDIEIDLKRSTSSNVIIYISSFKIQNQIINLNIFDKNNKNIYSSDIKFGDLKIVANFNQYIEFLYSELLIFLESKCKNIKTFNDYINLYNELNNQKYLSITTNNGFTINGNLTINYKNKRSNYSSMDYSISFNIHYLVEWNNDKNVQKSINKIIDNPDPLNDCNSSLEYVTKDGIHFKGNTIVRYTGNDHIIDIKERYEIRDNAGNRLISSPLTKINDSVFENKNIVSLSLPNSITIIGNRAFANNNINDLSLSSSLTSIGNEAFQNNKLSYLDFKNTNLTTIGDGAFENNLITEIKDWSNTTSIGKNAFKNCKITNKGLNLGNSKITSIGVEAFAYNYIQFNIGGNQLNKIIDLPINLNTIGVGAFEVKEKIEYFGGADANYDYFRQGNKGSQFFTNLTVINKQGQIRKFVTRYYFNIRIVNDVYTAGEIDIDRPIY